MTENKLQLNDGKTEALILSSQKSSSLQQSISVGQHEIKFAESVCNLCGISVVYTNTVLSCAPHLHTYLTY